MSTFVHTYHFGHTDYCCHGPPQITCGEIHHFWQFRRLYLYRFVLMTDDPLALALAAGISALPSHFPLLHTRRQREHVALDVWKYSQGATHFLLTILTLIVSLTILAMHSSQRLILRKQRSLRFYHLPMYRYVQYSSSSSQYRPSVHTAGTCT